MLSLGRFEQTEAKAVSICLLDDKTTPHRISIAASKYFSSNTQLKNDDRMIEFSADDFLQLGLNIINRSIKSNVVARERFQANYGTEAVVVADVWLRLMNSNWRETTCIKPTHLLWSLMFIKSYGKQREMAAKSKCDAGIVAVFDNADFTCLIINSDKTFQQIYQRF